jgi:putative spermidine/putrescine transport system substrate-binding protein
MTIHTQMTLFELTQRYPETIDVLVEAGFRRMTDPALRERFGSSITVEAAAHARGLAPEDLLARLEGVIAPETPLPDGEPRDDDGAAQEGARYVTSHRPWPIRVMGLVPCPIRVPMTNVLDAFTEKFTEETGISVDYNLQAAYTGTDWMEENIPADPRSEDVPEIFLSAGFRLFFTDERFLSLRRSGAFADRTGWTGLNDFGTSNGLADPEGRFSVIGVVPAVFMVNRHLLGDRPVPRTWQDILTPEYENSLALPIGDFDLFDALLLGVHRNFGNAGVEQLARNMSQQMHPAQMVAGARTGQAQQGKAQPGTEGSAAAGPVITVMPYFFTRTITEDSPLIPVWPEDGALAAPILLISRTDRPEIAPLVEEISGLPMSRVMSRLGLFPSTHPENDDFDAEEHPLQWPGWDLLLSPELPQLLKDTTALFQTVLQERHATGAPAPRAGAVS